MGRDFPPVQTGPGAQPAFCIMGTRSFQGVKYGRNVTLTTHPLLVPRSRKSRAIPLSTLWATTGPVMGTLFLYLYFVEWKKPSATKLRGRRSGVRNPGTSKTYFSFRKSPESLCGPYVVISMSTGVLSREYSGLNVLPNLGMSGAIHLPPPTHALSWH